MSAGKLGDLLVSQGLITHEQLKSAVDHRTKVRGRLSTSLVQLGHVNEKVLATFLSKQYGITAISLDDVDVPADLTRLVPATVCEKHMLVPLSLEGNRLSIAISDPTNVAAIDDVRFLSNKEITVYIATESSIQKLIGKSYTTTGAMSQTVQSMQSAIQVPKMQAARPGGKDSKEGDGLQINLGVNDAVDVDKNVSGDKPVIKLINQIFVEAIKKKASDIHIEPFESYTRIRLRLDGSLYEVAKIPPQMRLSLPARIKVMSQLDISEKRLPQDGRLQIKTKTSKIDVRVSILPTMFGEKVVLRILDQSSSNVDLLSIGFEEEQYKTFQKAAKQPYGMILVTGPTGSGKSTTLYAALNELNSIDVNISTVEDPVEYNMLGVNQVQMKESIGLNFAAALRSLLRQDPDIVMVGEIRDHETAEIGVKAALTGHMVFSTLHTNDAPSTISRLLHMGLEPFLITAALTLVQAQRLIRVNCERCAQPDKKVTQEMLIDAEMPNHWLESVKPMRGVGCERCGGTGYKGRKGIFEVMYMTERIRELVVKGANADELKKAAIDGGMMTLRQSSLLKLYRGETTLDEVLANSRPDGDLFKS